MITAPIKPCSLARSRELGLSFAACVSRSLCPLRLAGLHRPDHRYDHLRVGRHARRGCGGGLRRHDEQRRRSLRAVACVDGTLAVALLDAFKQSTNGSCSSTMVAALATGGGWRLVRANINAVAQPERYAAAAQLDEAHARAKPPRRLAWCRTAVGRGTPMEDEEEVQEEAEEVE